MAVLVELLGALFRYGRFARSFFLVQLAFLSSAKFAYFLKRSEGGYLCAHWNAKNQLQQKQNVSPTGALFWSKRCRVRSHSLIWKFLKSARATIKNFHGQGVVSKNRYHVHYCARSAEIDHAQILISGAHARTCSSKWVRVIAHTVQNRGARRWNVKCLKWMLNRSYRDCTSSVKA